MFKFNHKDFKEMEDDLLMDVGMDLRDAVGKEYSKKGEISKRGTPYQDARITHCPNKNIVGSEDWAPYVIDAGWDYGKFPNITAIKQWVRFVKDNGANAEKSDEEVDKEAYLVARKISQEGIIPTWFVTDTLYKFEQGLY